MSLALWACSVCAAAQDSRLGALLPAMLLLPYAVGWVAYRAIRPLMKEGGR